MTESDILGGILQREGGWRDQVTRPNGSIDPPTNMGITLPTLRAWRRRRDTNAIVDVGDLRSMSDAEAQDIYTSMYVDEPGFTPANIPFEPLRIQMIDFGCNSGPERAIRWLQRVLGMEAPSIDGVIGPLTRMRIGFCLGSHPCAGRWINDALVAARSYAIDQSVDQGIMRKEDEEGVESRALSFFLAKP